jgi:hypothetical protein
LNNDIARVEIVVKPLTLTKMMENFQQVCRDLRGNASRKVMPFRRRQKRFESRSNDVSENSYVTWHL